MKKSKIIVLSCLVLMSIGYFWYFSKYLTIDSLLENKGLIDDFIFKHKYLSPLLFIGLNFISTLLLLPTGLFLTIAGGFYFPLSLCLIYVSIGATAGACFVYGISLYLGKGFLIHRYPSLKKIESEFQKNKISYLMFLRIFPFSPFWLVNIASAFFEVPFWTFFWTTVVGNIPPTIVFIEIGRELNSFLISQGDGIEKSMLNAKAIVILISLAIICLLPIFIKKFRFGKKT